MEKIFTIQHSHLLVFTVSWAVMTCSLVYWFHCLQLQDPEVGVSRFLWNIDNNIPGYMASYPTTQQSWLWLMWESQNIQSLLLFECATFAVELILEFHHKEIFLITYSFIHCSSDLLLLEWSFFQSEVSKRW
jgi:hypothetical protein